MKNNDIRHVARITRTVARHLKGGDRSSAINTLMSSGFVAEAAMIERGVNRVVQHDLRCPAHKAPVASGCRMNSCKFWVGSDMANNCLLAYCSNQQTDRLSADEIAYLYGQPIETVRQELDAAMTTLRCTAIQSDAKDDPDIQRVFWFVETMAVCCVCGSTTDSTSLIRVPDTPLAYCSRECVEEASPDVVGCEYRFGRPIQTILRWAIRRFRNLPVLERTLGLKRETLIELSRRHLGRDLVSFFPKVKIKSEQPQWRRRTNVGEVMAAIDVLNRCTNTFAEECGRPIFDISNLRMRLQDILT
jgi:hypothetical protein